MRVRPLLIPSAYTRIITNTVVYCESDVLRYVLYPTVIGEYFATLLTERSPDTHPRNPPLHFSSSPLTSHLSRRQPVKNDRGVSLLGQWQIEYILASSEKRVLRFVYRLSCYAKDRNFCRLRIRQIDLYPTSTSTCIRWHCIIARPYTIITDNDSREIRKEKEKGQREWIAFATKIAPAYFETQEQFPRLRR